MKKSLLFFAMYFAIFCFLEVTEAASDIDPVEIHNTPIAKRLESLGYVEEEKDSGIYVKKQVELGVFLKCFNVSEKNLYPVPSCSNGEWLKYTVVDGNHTVLSRRSKDPQEKMATNTPIDVVINLGYARPSEIFLGITYHRLLAAFSIIKAKQITPYSIKKKEGDQVFRFLLPNGTGLELQFQQDVWDTRHDKPDEPTVKRMTIGEEGKGFDNWEKQTTKSASSIPIIKFRQNKD